MPLVFLGPRQFAVLMCITQISSTRQINKTLVLKNKVHSNIKNLCRAPKKVYFNLDVALPENLHSF